MKLDAATFLLQWSAGGLSFLWVTTRRREVSLGYGWLLRGVYGVFAVGAAAAFFGTGDGGAVRTVAGLGSAAVVAATTVALVVSVQRRAAGARGVEALRAGRRARVAAMIGRSPEGVDGERGPEFPPVLDLFAPAIGGLALFVAAADGGGPYVLVLLRLLVGAAFLGAVSDAMLLGHWYLVQPGLRRDPLKELVLWSGVTWPVEVALFLWPTGMVQVLDRTVDDGYHGLLGWIWMACAVTTVALVALTWAALKERSYSAVMAATGLLYLAILTAFGTDLLARAVLRP